MIQIQSTYGFCLAAPRSGEGKTTLAMGLMRAFTRRGMVVQGFKCGPDYVDPTFHSEATGRTSYNMDTWMMGPAGVQALWRQGMQDAQLGICEGVMGLFDGRPVHSLEGSTAHVAKVLNLPVILVFTARGMAASAAALVRGFHEQAKDHSINLVGCIANHVGSERHVDILREVLSVQNLPPLLGAVPRKALWTLPERQLGLVPQQEVAQKEVISKERIPSALYADTGKVQATQAWYDAMAQELEQCCDLDALAELCKIEIAQPEEISLKSEFPTKKLAIAKDHAFCFYYAENEKYLESLGYELIPFSPLYDAHLPEGVQAVYLGGGYPEVFAKELSANASMRASIKAFAENNGEIYAECGGYMYLCSQLLTPCDVGSSTLLEEWNDTMQAWDMCNVLKATATMGTRLQALGYRQVKLLSKAPLGLGMEVLRGHEFHWSHIEHHAEYKPLYAVEVRDTVQNQGVIYKNVKAGYVHLYWGRGRYEG